MNEYNCDKIEFSELSGDIPQSLKEKLQSQEELDLMSAPGSASFLKNSIYNK